jgi:type II secretory pathway component GspD/PulD (secretin)
MVGVTLLALCIAGGARAQDGEPAGESALITLVADLTPVADILEILAERSGLNIVTSAAVQGQMISLRLEDTPFEEALNLVCRSSGLGYERMGNSILVADQGSLTRATGLTSRVFDLEYADAEELSRVLAVISPDIKAEISRNRLIMWAPQSTIEQTERTIEVLDRKPAQVLLEARLIEVNRSKVSEYGIQWDKITNWTGVITEGMSDPTNVDQLPTESGFVPLDSGDTYYRQLEAFEIAIDAMIDEGAARLLSDTRVVTLDGQAAEIFAGETVPVVITSLSSPGGSGGVLQTVQLEKIDVGVRLNITPRVTGDGMITALVEPEVSRIINFVGPDDDLPQTSTRRAKTSVRVKDGETIYLGGLLTEEKRKSVSKVPILGSIPILGYLFQHRREETARLDLVIEITPRIVGDSGSDLPEYARPTSSFDDDDEGTSLSTEG